MGRRVFNAKARQNPQTIVDNSTIKNLKIDLVETASGAGYDEANALVLPSKKRETKIKIEKKQHVRILNKKQRKHLQTIVDKKQKKLNRAQLLEDLAAVQIPATELQQYTSISQVQTVGVKKLKTLDELLSKKLERAANTDESVGKISSIKGAAKRKLLLEDEQALAAKRADPNYVGLDIEDSDSSIDVDDDEAADTEIKEVQQVQEKELKPTENLEEVQKPQHVLKKTDAVDAKEETVKKPVRATVFVPVLRDADIQNARLKLPILAEEQLVMETINENSIVIVAGETGSGKTTQIPQFLYEAGYASKNKMIGVTEPRRVAAIAMSKRVAHEMNLSEREVSYLIRFEGNATPDTRIKFMTDGVLLKEVEKDFLLRKYSVIILDEAHERSAYTDILIGLLSRIVPLREKRNDPLKLIIMSATLRVEDFLENKRLFKIPPPLVKVETRQFPVTVHFQKHTPENYVEEAYRKTVKIHSKLPEGGILIFVTGQQEVNTIVRRLRRTFPYVCMGKKQLDKKDAQEEKNTNEEAEEEIEFDMKRAIQQVRQKKKKFIKQLSLPKINLDDYKLPSDDTEADMLEQADSDAESIVGANEFDDIDEDEENDDCDMHVTATKQPLWVLPLYSLLGSEKQKRIFEAPPEGCRLCVVSTNVAETSLTIPNIKYVVDSGRQKTRLYDKITGVSAFVVTYTSKASADQRAGRAGRTSAGHCYRLYSSAVYKDEFENFSMPDIQKKPVDDLMLQMRCMGIDRVVNFPFPSPPDETQLKAAEGRLVVLGALERINDQIVAKDKELPPRLTHLGRVIACFPVAPRFGKMLALSHQQNLLPYTVCMVAALSVQEVLSEVGVNPEKDADHALSVRWQRKRQSWAGTGNYELLGDPMILLRAVGAAEYAGSEGNLATFCHNNGLRLKAITEVRKMRVQLTNEINLNVTDANLSVDPRMEPPSDKQARFLRQILLTGMGDHVARKVPLEDVNDKEEKRRLKYAYNCSDMEDVVFLHATSVLKSKCPEWVIYQEAYEMQSGDTTKMFIRGITAIEPEWLLLYVPLLCNIRSVKEDPAPRYSAKEDKIYCYVDASFGKAGWELPLSEIEMPLNERACSYFGMFLLDGQIFSVLANYKSKLKVTPSSLIKSWSNLNQNVMRFKRPLITKAINSRQKLSAEWEQNPNFLLEEYHNMLYEVALAELTSIWPPKDVPTS